MADRRDRRALRAGAVLIVLVGASMAAGGAVEAEVTFDRVGADIVGEQFSLSGVPVAMSADGGRVVIGAVHGRDQNGDQVGHVRVYDWEGTTWTQVGEDIDGEAAGGTLDRNVFGVALGISADGNRVAIGDWRHGGSGSDSGTVRVFDWDGATWAQAGADIDGEASRDFSGGSVALSADGNRVAIDAMGNDGSDTNAGHVRVFDWDGTTWTQAGADIDGEAAGDGFEDEVFTPTGNRVALSGDGDRVAIGARRNDGSGTDAGHVRVFDWDGTTWAQAGADIDGEAAGDASGEEVALSADGNRLAIGARGNDGSANGAGHVRVFDWDGTTWTQAGADIDGEAAGDGSGVGVALSGDGTRVAIGAAGNGPTRGIGTTTGAGHVRVFDWDGTAWAQAGTDIDGEAAGDASGVGVAWSDDGNRLAIGAILAEDFAGHVRVFDVNIIPTTPTSTTSTTMVVPAPDGILPETGGAPTSTFWLFVLITGAGLALVAVARRRPV